jgi:hypothetical protein
MAKSTYNPGYISCVRDLFWSRSWADSGGSESVSNLVIRESITWGRWIRQHSLQCYIHEKKMYIWCLMVRIYIDVHEYIFLIKI